MSELELEQEKRLKQIPERKEVIGIDITTIIPKRYINCPQKYMHTKEFKEQLNKVQRMFSSLQAKGKTIYIFVPTTKEKHERNYRKILKKYKSNYKHLIFCKEDLIGALREYRVDVAILPKSKLKLKDAYVDKFAKPIGKRQYKERRTYALKHKDEKTVEVRQTEELTADYLPDYMRIIHVGSLSNGYSTDRIFTINSLLEVPYFVDKALEKARKWKEDIFKSYEYVPKTGNPSFDKEWKPYFISSKFENNQMDEQTQKMTKLEFIKYHNRFNLDDNFICYLPLKKWFTYNDIIEMTEKLCRSFKKMGLKQGDVVTSVLPNTVEDYCIGLALQHIGVSCNPIHPMSPSDKIERFVSQLHPKYFIWFDMPKEEGQTQIDLPSLMDKYGIKKTIKISPIDSANRGIKMLFALKSISQKLKGKDKYQSVLEQKRYKMPTKESILTFNDLLNYGNDYQGSIDVTHQPDEISYYYTTGGTTANRPKIVAFPYALTNVSYYNSYGITIEKGDVAFTTYPRYIAFCDSNCIHQPASVGLKLLFSPFEYPKDYIKTIEKYGVTVDQRPPQYYEMMLKDDEQNKYDANLSSVRYFVGGADKTSNNLKSRIYEFAQQHNNEKLNYFVGLGDTEHGGSTIVQLFETGATTDEKSVGLPLPCFDIKIVDEDGKEIEDGKEGKLLIATKDNLKVQYFNDEEATEKASITDENGIHWYDTGDIVDYSYAKDEAKKDIVRYIGREKRFVMITKGSYSGKANPEDIECLINESIPGVKNCCVVGVPDLEHNMTLKAAVELKENITPDDQIKEQIKQVARNKDILNELSDVLFVDELPLTDRRKVKFLEVEEIFSALEKDESPKVFQKTIYPKK